MLDPLYTVSCLKVHELLLLMLLRHFSSHRDRKAGDVGELLHRALWSFLWISLQFPCRCSGPAGRVSVPRVSLRLLAQSILAYSSHSWRQPQTEPHSLSLSKCLSFAGVRLLAFGKSNVYLFVCRIASCFRKLIESLLKLFAWPSFTEDLVPVGLERNCNEGWDQIEALRPGRMIPLCRFNSLPNWQA